VTERVEVFLTVAAGIIVASMLDSVLASVLNPILTAVKGAPYNG
jgi:hypothetical protein